MARQITYSGTYSGSKIITVSRIDPPFTITLSPGSGNVSSCEIKSGGKWFAWPAGDVSEPMRDVQYGHIEEVKFTRVSGSSDDTYEVVA